MLSQQACFPTSDVLQYRYMNKIPTILKNVPHTIPACDECGEDMVRFGKGPTGWICRYCTELPKLDSMGQVQETIQFMEIFPNRAARRRR